MGAVDFLIRGQGIAGTLLARELLRRGASVALLDRRLPGAASEVAPGLINPLAGRKFEPVWWYDRLWPVAEETYRALEAELGVTLLQQRPLLRLFTEADQPELLARAAERPEVARFIEAVLPPGHHAAQVHDVHGSVRLRAAGWVDLKRLTQTQAAVWQKAGILLDPATPEAALPTARHTIEATGWRAGGARWNFIPFNPARGELMTVSFAPNSLPEAGEIHFGQWLQPLDDGRWRCGATYAWSGFEAPPTLAAQATLQAALRRWVVPTATLHEQTWGVRPTVRDYQPVLGRHPEQPEHSVFAGLGTRGVLNAPLCAKTLAEHLLDQRPLPPELSLQRFRR